MQKTVDILQIEVKKQALFIAELQQEITLLKAYILQLQNRKFGASADCLDVPNQMNLFDEAEAVVEQEADIEEPVEVVVKKQRKRGGRKPLPQTFKRVTILHDIPESEKLCDECHQLMTVYAVDTTEKLRFIPASFEVEVHERPKYGCKCCECAPKQAKPAPQAIPKGIATASLLSHILIPSLWMPRRYIVKNSNGNAWAST